MKPILRCLLFLALIVSPESASAAVVAGFDQTVLERNDDGSAGPVDMGFEIDLFGTRTRTVFVNNNGNVTFDSRLSTFTPFNLLSTQRLIIAPFFADVDTRAAGDPVRYGSGSFEGRPAFGINWVNVDYFSSSPNHPRSNSFQLILVSRSDRGNGDFDIVFNYDRIGWETGQASGGDANGLGGSSARAGYAIGRGAPGSAFELAGSAQNGAFLDGGPRSLVAGSRNSSEPGRYVFEIRSAQDAQISALTPFADAPSVAAVSDASGSYVVFQSLASNLTSSDPNPGSDIFRIDTRSGVIERVSLDDAGNPISGDAIEAAVSQDGQLVLFAAPDAGVGAVQGEDQAKREARQKGGGSGVFLRNMLTGRTQRLGAGNSATSGTRPRISASGSHAVFIGTTTSSSEGQVGQDNVYRVALNPQGDSTTPGMPRCVSCKSVNADGSESSNNSNGIARSPTLSASGDWVAWESTASNAHAGTAPACASAASRVLLRNMQTGVVTTASTPGSGGACGSGGSRAPQIDSGGSQLVFESDQPLTGGDGNGQPDIYSLDIQAGSKRRVSETSSGTVGNGASTQPAISGNGQVVAFISSATNLDPSGSDSNGVADVHVKSLSSGQAGRLAGTDTGGQADGPSARPGLNHDGSLVVFDSVAGNLAPGAVTGQPVIFQRANPLVSGVLRSATWWKSDESGWGLFIFDQGSVLAPAWFTYDVDGEPTWFLAAGAFLQADGSYRGELFRFTGVPLAQITGNAVSTTTSVGEMVLRFSGDASLQFQYTVNGLTQTKTMTRFPFGTRTISCSASAGTSRAAANNYSDVWWGGESTPGWGLFLNHVDNLILAVWYTYDVDGEALFLVIVAERQADGSFSGELFRQRDGTPFSQINGSPPSVGADIIGTARFSFSNGEVGTFSYTLGGVTQSKPITRLLVGDLASECESVPAMR